MTGKLTTIVVVDVSGFSRRARADEAGAIAAVAELDARCTTIAAAHDGRVFNTSGDAVMMEFANVAGALQAAEELIAHPEPPIRVAVHLGEATAMPNGDMIGHGVKIAAELQTHAKAGHVLVSDNAKRALRGPLASRLASKGVVRIEKSSEFIAIHELQTASEPHGDKHHLRPRLLIGLAVALLALSALWVLVRPTPPARVAVFALQAASDDPALWVLAGGISDDVSSGLNAGGSRVVPRNETPSGPRADEIAVAKRHSAALAFLGTAERTGDGVRVVVSTVDTSSGATLWSNTFDGADASDVRMRAASQSAAVMRCGVSAASARGGRIAAQSMIILLRACAVLREPGRAQEAHDLLTQVVQREPRLALGHALLAEASVRAAESAPAAQAEQLRTQARSEAELARRNDQHIGESYLALEALSPREAIAVRETALQQGLQQDADNAELNGRYAQLLRDAGRLDDALTHARHASTLDPASPARAAMVADLMLDTGDTDGAHTLIQRLQQTWPQDSTIAMLRIREAMWSNHFEEAQQLIAAPTSPLATPGARACWRQAADDLRTGNHAGAARAIACYQQGDLPGDQAIKVAASLGEPDQAFALTREPFFTQPGAASALFAPATQSMRASPQFMPLMKTLGLLRYWDLGNHYADFCEQGRLPYRCQTEARRLLHS